MAFWAQVAYGECHGIDVAPLDTATPFLSLVVGVGSNDILNVRSLPSANSADVGDLPFDAKDVEIIDISDDRKWGKINQSESVAWVRLCYISPSPDQALFERLSCHGNEPFWNFKIQGARFHFDRLDGETILAELKGWQSSPNDIRDYGIQSNDQQSVSISLTRASCSDGMSDRAYGLKTTAFVDGKFYSGCCSLR